MNSQAKTTLLKSLIKYQKMFLIHSSKGNKNLDITNANHGLKKKTCKRNGKKNSRWKVETLMKNEKNTTKMKNMKPQ